MRKGTNPAKSDTGLNEFQTHRIIIPVYIPSLDGYFEHSLDVLNISLHSLKSTIPAHAAVTIVSNNSAREVEELLLDKFRSGWFDELVLNQVNRGKVDAIIAAARASFCEIVTFADCDVLFLPNWAEAVEQIFSVFPECGSVTPFPSPGGVNYYTSSTLLGAAATGTLKFGDYVQEEDFDLIVEGIGRDPNTKFREAQWIVQREDVKACIGGGHFVISFHRSIIDSMPKEPSLETIGGIAEKIWLDQYPDKAGYWRLSTIETFVYHIGNTPTYTIPSEKLQNRFALLKRHLVQKRKKHITSIMPWRDLLAKVYRRFFMTGKPR